MPTTKPRLPRTVIALGLVSLFTDLSSEMIVPLLPVFLTATIGASASFFGLVEGLAESVASLLKLFSGAWSDKTGGRRAWVLGGYSLSTLMRPLMGFCTAPWQVLVVRSSDRVGKGLRSAPRDALLTAATPPEIRGWAFGFHRAMDHAGAMLGALAAWAFLHWGWKINDVFLMSAVPGLFAVAAIVLGVGEKKETPSASAARPQLSWRDQPESLKKFIIVLGVFVLGNSSDAFLLLKAHEVGIPVVAAPWLWIVLHLTKMLTNLVGGRLSDRFGPRRTIIQGWLWYGLVYVLFGLSSKAWHIWVLFAVYGLYHGLTEGAEKALIAAQAPKERRGEVFGLYHAITGAMALPASLLMGLMWQAWGSTPAFIVESLLALVAAFMFHRMIRESKA